MKIALASDHGGFQLKQEMKKYLEGQGYEILDLGTDSEESVDYIEYGQNCAQTVVDGKADKGIVFCGTGIGVSIAANKVKGARCALCTNGFMAGMAAAHNNANLIALGGRILSKEEAINITDTWLKTDFEGGRHQRRVDKLDSLR